MLGAGTDRLMSCCAVPLPTARGARFPMSPRKHVTGPQAFICGGDLTSGPRDDCPNVLHDFPLPAGYVDASEAAEKRLRHRWRNARCPDCGLYGWRPGDPTGDLRDERVPAPVTPVRGKEGS